VLRGELRLSGRRMHALTLLYHRLQLAEEQLLAVHVHLPARVRVHLLSVHHLRVV
jgi:hypothetical protein